MLHSRKSSNISTSTLTGGRSIKKKRKKKATERSIEILPTEVKVKTSFEILGVTTLILSTISQKVIGCAVGENVTAESPWVEVRKELVMDNIELHEESSEFLAIGNEILAYPEPTILVGWIPAASDKHDEFYIVYTLEAKEQVLEIIARQQTEMQERLLKMVKRPVGYWYSYGSEDEVNESMVRNTRPLFEIEIESKFPLIAKPIRFDIRLVEDVIDGYVELLQDVRYPIENIEKRRVHVSVQAAPIHITNEVQTTPTFPVNMATQYEYNYQPAKPQEDNKNKVLPPRKKTSSTMILNNVDDVFEYVFFNEHVNIYKDDYEDLMTEARLKVDLTGTMHRFLTCSEPSYTKGKYVGDCAWSLFTSGILATCYTDFCATAVTRTRQRDLVDSDVEGPPPVLIWSYTDGLQPKLFLESPREVTYLSWCPYQKDLLIGGTISGQIVVWNVANKIKEVETPEILSSTQKNNRASLLRLVEWMKITLNPSVVQPVLCSNLIYSHKAPITNIRWLPSNCEISKNGKCYFTDRRDSRQFVTTSIDGTILVWDMNLKIPDELKDALKARRKSKRVKEMPVELAEKQLNLNVYFKPHFIIKVAEKPIITIMRRPTRYCHYTPVDNKEADQRASVRTEFRLIEDEFAPFVNENMQTYVLGTTTGGLFDTKVEGYDFDVGTAINSEEASVDSFLSIHDGPIVHCETHPTCTDYSLTIGGTLFTIWHSEKRFPIIWRKAKNGLKYIAGGWVVERPGCIMLVRSDGSIEIWDLLVNSTKPIRTVNMGGDLLLKVFGFVTPSHARKNTIAFSDTLGTLNLYFIPEILQYGTKHEDTLIKLLMDRSYESKVSMCAWMNKYAEQFYILEEKEYKMRIDSIMRATLAAKSQIVERKEDYFSQVEKLNKIFDTVVWESVEQKNMFDAYIKRKGVDIEELIIYKDKLAQFEKEKGLQKQKQHLAIDHKDSNFMLQSTKLLASRTYLDRKRELIIPDVISEEDCCMIADFDKIEVCALFYIKAHPFQPDFEWSKVVTGQYKLSRRIQDWLKYRDVPLIDMKRHPYRQKLTPITTSTISEDQSGFDLRLIEEDINNSILI